MKALLHLFDFSQKVNYRTEVFAGFTVAMTMIPESLSFAILAGLSPLTGLYAAFIMGLVTALFGGRPGMVSGGAGATVIVLIALMQSHGVEYVFAGKKVLVTSGPTYEQIDPVRFISNHSTGKMGQALAVELVNKGAEVTLVSGPVAHPLTDARIQIIPVVTAAEMHQAAMSVFPMMDIAIMAAAVADYTPVQTATQKIKKSANEFSLPLKKTTDILKHAGEIKKDNQLLVGFALETNNEAGFAQEKLKQKNADIIILNSLNDTGAGFGHDTNKVTVFFKEGATVEIPLQSKQVVAAAIVQILIEKVNA